MGSGPDPVRRGLEGAERYNFKYDVIDEQSLSLVIL